MASMTRIGYQDTYASAKKIFHLSDSKEIRREAKAIAVLMEKCVGQLDSQPAETWKV